MDKRHILSTTCLLYTSYLRGGEISVDHQSGLLLDTFRPTLRFKFLAIIRRTAILPYDRVVYGKAILPVPDDGSLPLVSDSDTGDIDVYKRQTAVRISTPVCSWRASTMRTPSMATACIKWDAKVQAPITRAVSSNGTRAPVTQSKAVTPV